MCNFSKVPLNRLLTLLNNIEQQQSQLEQYRQVVYKEIDRRFPDMLQEKPKVYKKEK